MSTWEIKGKNDVVKAIINSLEYNGKWMEERYVSATIDSPVPIDFAIGDYLIYRGERFEINYDPGKIKSAPPEKKGDGFKYENVKFNDLSDELTRCEFLDVVPNDNLLHYTSLPKFRFYGSVRDLAGRIKANLDRVYPGQWTIAVSSEYSDTKELNISVEPINVKGALGFVVNDFKAYYTIKGRTITIGAAGIPAAHLFKYGKGNGLYEIAQNAEADQKIVTRLRAYGSTRNLPHRYYNSLSGANGLKLVPDNMAVSNLMLPDFPYNTLDPYIDSANKAALGIREGTIFFDGSQEGIEEIYPSIEGMTAEQLKAAGVPCNSTGNLDELVSADQMSDDGVGVINGDKTEAEPPTFKVTVKDLGFNLWDHRTSETPVLSFKTGMLDGREFEIVNCEAIKGSGDKTVGYELELNRVYDDDIKLWFPYKDYNAKGSDQNTSFPDKFVLLHIEMPEVYVKAAAQRLKEAAEAWLAKNDYSRSVYAPKVDEIFMARQHDEAMASGGTIASLHDTLCEGMLMLFEDEDLNIDASIFIDQLTIKEGDGPVPTYEVVLKEEKTVGRLDKMQNQIDSLASGIGQNGGYNAAQIRALIETYGGRRFLSKLEDDTAAGVIEFLRGLVADEIARLRGGAEFGDFESGMSTGRGGAIDDAGNGELESLRVRSYLEVLELIVNRLQAIEGDTVLTESDQITEVTDLGGGNYKIKLKEKWDGYFTAMTVDTVLRGIYNTMSRGGGDYYTSWMLVTSVDTAANELTVMLYGDDEVPGEKNFAPIAMMNIARWGHRTDERLQRCLYLSSTEGRIVNLVGVRQPLLTAANYGSTFGRVPEFISRAFGFAEGQEGVYTKYLFVENLFHVDHLGVPLPTVRDRGLWTAGGDYYDGTTLREATGDYEISDVWHEGRRWRCCKLATTAEPSRSTTDWAYIEGLTLVSTKTEYALSLSGTVTPPESAWSEVQPEPVALMWLWTRTTLTFSDGSTSVSYTKSYMAKDGVDGIDGQPGDKGDKGDPGKDGADGKDGARGERGPALRGPQRWADVADGFGFESGGDGEDFLDVVMTESLKPGSTTDKQVNYFVCIQSHTKSTSIRPDAAGSQYWKPMSTIEFVATKILLAQYAVIKNLGVESLEMKDADGNVIAYIHDGNVLFNKGTFSNVKVVAGGTTEQRIELDPDTKSIRIYDDAGNECLTIDGTRQEREAIEGYKLELTAPGAAPTPWTLPIDKTTTTSGLTIPKTLLTMTPAEDSYITVNVPKLTLTVKRETPGSSTAITGDTEVKVTLQVAQGTEVANEEIGSYLLENGTTVTGERTVEFDSIRKSFKVKAGVAMTLKLFVEAHFASGSVKLTSPTATYVFDRYQSKIFANGMTLMRTNRDYLTIYADRNGRIYLDRGSTAGSCHRFNGVSQPATLYAARVWNDIDNAQPTVYAGAATVVKGPTAGMWYVTMPADALVHTGNTLAYPVCNTPGWTVAETARVMVGDALRFTVMTCNASGTPAWGADFTIEIKLY